MVHKHSNRELFEKHLDSHSEPFIICCLAVIYRLLVSKSVAMTLSFLFRSSTLPHAAISCHLNAAFHSRRNPQNVVSEIARCRMNPNHQKLPAELACLSLTPMSPSEPASPAEKCMTAPAILVYFNVVCSIKVCSPLHFHSRTSLYLSRMDIVSVPAFRFVAITELPLFSKSQCAFHPRKRLQSIQTKPVRAYNFVSLLHFHSQEASDLWIVEFDLST
jgi:hypothetical protein